MDPADSASPGIDLKSLEDKQLVIAIREGREDAVSELYDRYSNMLVALSHRVLGDAADSEEVLQEVFLQVWNQAARYDPARSSVSTWLVLITRSRSIDRLRSRRVKERTATAAQKENPVTHESPAGIKHVFRQEQRKRLQEELAQLPPEQREVLEMAFYRGMTQSEIAGETGIPLGTVKTRTLLAMKKLRKALSDEIRELL
jgi:RNA polymerase sigma-70 factor (ECF subfamily)